MNVSFSKADVLYFCCPWNIQVLKLKMLYPTLNQTTNEDNMFILISKL